MSSATPPATRVNRPPPSRLTRFAWPIYVVGIPLAGGLAVAVGNEAGWILVAIGSAYLWWYLGIVIHETAHGLAARCLGWRVHLIQIGWGPDLIWQGRTLGWRWDIRASKLAGFTFASPLVTVGYRWKKLLFVLAGPAGSFVLMAAGGAWLGAWADASTTSRLFPLMPLFVGGALVYGSLRPRMLKTPAGDRPSDGLSIWRLLRGRELDANASVRDGRLFEAWLRVEEGDYAGAMELAPRGQDGAAEASDSLAIEGIVAMRTGDFERAISLDRRALGAAPEDAKARTSLANGLAYALICRGNPRDIEEAVALARSVCEAQPDSAAYLGTLGAALVLEGRMVEGLGLLDRSSAGAPRPQDRAENACWKSLGLAGAGRRDEAAAMLAEAESLDPRCFLLPRTRLAVVAAGPDLTPRPS